MIECYHAPVRQVYNISRKGIPYINDEDALQMSVKAANDSIGSHCIVSTLPLLGALPRIGMPMDRRRPSMFQRAVALRKATSAESKTI